MPRVRRRWVFVLTQGEEQKSCDQPIHRVREKWPSNERVMKTNEVSLGGFLRLAWN